MKRPEVVEVAGMAGVAEGAFNALLAVVAPRLP